MKAQFRKTLIISATAVFSTMPFSVSAAPSAGINPTSLFYFLDIASERVGLFFTFGSEKKARKALEYADERLAEAEVVAGDNNTEAVKTAITNYESSIAFAAEKSKDIGDEEKAEAVLSSIADNTSRHQGVLTGVLAKVPDEAREAVTRALETSRRGQEEALKQIAGLKQEIAELKQEIVELKKQQGVEPIPSGNNGAQNQLTGIKELKKEIEELKEQATKEIEQERPAINPEDQLEVTKKNQEALTAQSQQLVQQNQALADQNQKLGEIAEEQKKQTDTLVQQNQTLQQIQVNTTPVVSPVSVSAPVPAAQVIKDLVVKVDKSVVPINDWSYVGIETYYTENGNQVNANISFDAPEKGQHRSSYEQEHCGGTPKLCSKVIHYSPITFGKKILTLSANGVTKTIDINAIPYVKTDSIIQSISPNQFTLSSGDEPQEIHGFEYETSIEPSSSGEILRICNGGGSCIIGGKTAAVPPASLGVDNSTWTITTSDKGDQWVRFTRITLVGKHSGLLRYVRALPITLGFDVK